MFFECFSHLEQHKHITQEKLSFQRTVLTFFSGFHFAEDDDDDCTPNLLLLLLRLQASLEEMGFLEAA